MASRALEERLAALTELRGAQDRTAASAQLRKALATKTGAVIAAAAVVARDDGYDELLDDMPPAFSRLCEDGIKRDPACRGKLAIARALLEASRWSPDVFERGITYVQHEPVWGGREDTAATLRGYCALAFAQMGVAEAIEVIAVLLADPERAARLGAAQALGDSGRPDAVPLLRYKALVGDDEPEVLTNVFGSLLSLDPSGQLGFVGQFLDAPTGAGVGESAAIALGESRLDGALELLLDWCERAATAEGRRVGYVAIALLRSDGGNRYLLEVIRRAAADTAAVALGALAPFRGDEKLAERVLAAAEHNPDDAVLAAARESFP